jgi:hypothetical protein
MGPKFACFGDCKMSIMTTLRILPLVFLLLPSLSFAQGSQNNIQTGVTDASAAAWKFPTRTFTNLPTAATSTGQRFTVTDCATIACTAGSGTIRQDMVSNGQLTQTIPWASIPGTGTAVSGSVQFSGGALVQ